MKIQKFSQQGKRSNNEDSLGYSEGLFTVCDGIGGHVSGERASAFVVDAMLKAFQQPQPIGKMEIQQQLNKVQSDLNQLLETEPELEKMGTTFTGIFLTPDVWYAAHIGDSRIYFFRPSERKMWHTWDHSLVGELMRSKEISIEAGRFHPMSNRIAKAIIAQKEGRPYNASIVKIDQLKPGDIFLLCSDGVVEGWGDLELVNLFSDTSLSFEQQCEKLRQQCDEKSKDNNTALLIQIEEADAFNYGSNDELEWTTFDEVEADYQRYLRDNAEVEEEQSNHEDDPVDEDVKPVSEPSEPIPSQPSGKHKKNLLAIILPIVLAIGAFVAFMMLKGGKTDGNGQQEPEQVENELKEPENEKVNAVTKVILKDPRKEAAKKETVEEEPEADENQPEETQAEETQPEETNDEPVNDEEEDEE